MLCWMKLELWVTTKCKPKPLNISSYERVIHGRNLSLEKMNVRSNKNKKKWSENPRAFLARQNKVGVYCTLPFCGPLPHLLLLSWGTGQSDPISKPNGEKWFCPSNRKPRFTFSTFYSFLKNNLWYGNIDLVQWNIDLGILILLLGKAKRHYQMQAV